MEDGAIITAAGTVRFFKCAGKTRPRSPRAGFLLVFIARAIDGLQPDGLAAALNFL